MKLTSCDGNVWGTLQLISADSSRLEAAREDVR